jgi:PIN domain nuclease of toxin-antitoxin system
MEDRRLSRAHRTAYLNPASELFLSFASVWEMLIKIRLGKLAMPRPAVPFILEQIEKNRVLALPIRASHLAELETLPLLTRDPFDRMLVAQAKAENMPILSADPAMRRYDIRVL